MKKLLILISTIGFLNMNCESNVLEPVNDYGRLIIQFNISKEGNGLLEIENRYDTLVKSFDLGYLPTGSHGKEWDMTDNEGNPVVEGVYFIYVYVSGEPIITGRQILVFNYE